MDFTNFPSLIPDRRKEIVRDLRRAIKNGDVTGRVAFNVPMRPQQGPPLEKAEFYAETFRRYKSDLAGCGLPVGLNVLFIMHGDRGITRADDAVFPRCVDPDGKPTGRICPLNATFVRYVRDVFATLAGAGPDYMVMDEDLRFDPGTECFCQRHLDAFNRRARRPLGRDALAEALRRSDAASRKIGARWDDTLNRSLFALARAARAGMDSVNPELLCEMKLTPGFRYMLPISRILAGKHPPVVRVNNPLYMAGDPRRVAGVMYSTARQVNLVRRAGIERVYSESDSYPEHRYATSAKILGAQITASVLDGVTDVELRYMGLHTMEWEYEHDVEQQAGYRRIVRKYRGFWEKMKTLRENVAWRGPAVPLPDEPEFFWNPIDCGARQDRLDFWFAHFCARLGIPAFPGNDADVYMLHGLAGFTDAQIARFLKKGVLLTGPAAAELQSRGFGGLLGVSVEKGGFRVDGEAFADDADLNGEAAGKAIPVNNATLRLKTLRPADGRVRILSSFFRTPWQYHPDRTTLSPAVTFFRNRLGGRVAVCAYGDFEGFRINNLVNPIRKAQFRALFARLGGRELPFVAAYEYELCLRHGQLPDGKELLFAMNLGLDEPEHLDLHASSDVSADVARVRRLTPAGQWEEQAFSRPEPGLLRIKRGLKTLAPELFLLHGNTAR